MDAIEHRPISPAPPSRHPGHQPRGPRWRGGGRSWAAGLFLLLTPLAIGSMPLRASAQDATRPLVFEVRPSGVVAETPEEALDRRLKQREYLFRSICNHCSRGDRFSSGAPFKPYDALAAPPPRPEQD